MDESNRSRGEGEGVGEGQGEETHQKSRLSP